MKRFIAIAVFHLCIGTAFVAAADKSSYDFGQTGRYHSTSKTTVAWARQVLQGFNFRIWLSNQGTMGKTAFDNAGSGLPPIVDGQQTLGCEYPLGSGIEHLFGAGIWIGGIDSATNTRAVTEGYNGYSGESEILPNSQDSLRDKIWAASAGDTLFNATLPGYYKIPMNKRNYDDDQDGKIDEDELDGLDNDHDWVRATDDIGADGLPDSLEHGCKGTYDPVRNPDPANDNYDPASFDSCRQNSNGTFPKKSDKNRYTEHNGIPDHGEPHVDEDYAAISDKDYYLSGTDTFKVPSMPNHRALGIKVFQKSYAWQGEFADAILPMEYYIVNVQKHVINNVYIAFFADMDVGPTSNFSYPTHNYTAYLPDLRTAYIHNPVDRGSTPLGITVLQTPRPIADLKYMFRWWDLGGPEDPAMNDSLIYEIMSGAAYPNQLIKPDQPVTSLSDSRFFFSFGPFGTLRPGDTLKLSIAMVSGYCVDACPGSLVENAQKAIRLQKKNYYPHPFFPSFHPTVMQTPGKITLRWGPGVTHFDPMNIWDDVNYTANSFPDTSWRRHDPPPGHTTGGRVFEGYRVYRSDDSTGSPSSFRLLCDYDLAGDIFGANSGLDTTYTDTTVVTGRSYWYAVTWYSIPDRDYIEAPDSTGYIHYDTVYVEGGESSLLSSRVKVLANGGISTVHLVLRQGWNLHSNPLHLANDSIAMLYPQTAGAFRYATDTGYVPIAIASPGAGYWIKGNAPASVSVTGATIAVETVNVAPHWNLVGSISDPVTTAGIVTDPPDLSLSYFYGYGANGYSVAGTLQPGSGYWIKSNKAGKIILTSGQAAANAQRQRNFSTGEPPPPPGETAEEARSGTRSYSLASNYPNPFNPTTDIGFQMADVGYATLAVYDVLGHEIATLVNEVKAPGEYHIQWNAANQPSGVYFYRLDATSISDPKRHFSQTRKMALIR